MEKAKKIRLPAKRSINLAAVTEKKVNLAIAIPAIILIVAAALFISKVAVFDRFAAASKADREVSELESKIKAAEEKRDGLSDVDERYEHYTLKEMTPEELASIDRVDIIDMLDRVVRSRVTIDEWTVTGTDLTIKVSDESDAVITLVTKELADEEIVKDAYISEQQTTENDKRSTKKVSKAEYYSATIKVTLIGASEKGGTSK